MKSKVTFENVLRATVTCIFAALFSQTLFGQDAVTVRLETSADRPGEVSVELRSGNGFALPQGIWFSSGVARFSIPSGRVLSVEAFDGSQKVAVAKNGPLQYTAEARYDRLRIVQSLSASSSVDESAFRSWILDGIGVLFLEDLLPYLDTNGGKISAHIMTVDGLNGGSQKDFSVGDFTHAAIAVGPGVDGFVGSWPLSKTDADAMASEILANYSKNILGTSPPAARFLFVRLPSEKFGRDRWAAQTIGSTVLIVSTGTQFPTQEKQRLHEQLRHEIFHLWFPNLAGLKGKYDWFYEGFALYESLKYATNSGRITFDDFLSSLSGAYGVATRGDAVSLISLSESRFAGSERQIYAKGMLVAFFTDVVMLDASGGRASSSDLVKSIFSDAVNAKGAVANGLILSAFSARPELRAVAEAYINGTAPLTPNPYFEKAGLSSAGTALSVVRKPSGRQRTVLDKLGYNAWRKSAPKIK